MKQLQEPVRTTDDLKPVATALAKLLNCTHAGWTKFSITKDDASLIVTIKYGSAEE